jgi:putative transposase
LTKLFPPTWLDGRARHHDVIVRDRKLDVTALVWSLVFGFAVGGDRAIENLRRMYLTFADHSLCSTSFHDRLTTDLAALLRELIDEALTDAAAPHTMADQLDHFRDLIVTDSTVVQLHDLLADTFPATHDDRASAKLHLVHNVTDGTVERLDLSDGRTHDSTRFWNGSWLGGRLLLFDLGYFKYHRFVRIDENGGFFVSRLKRNANPEIVEELRSWRGNARPLVGENVWDVVEDLHRSEIDALVEVEFKRRTYAGSRSIDTTTFRLVGLYNDATGEYHCYLTNLPAETFDPAQVAALYRARWEIELLFRELKTTYGLDELPSSKPAVVEVLLLASILTLVVSRVLLGLLRDVAAEREEAVTFPPERLARVFEAVAPLLADRVARSLGYDPPDLLEFMYQEAQKQQARPLMLESVAGALARD